ncbi:flagellar biosynthetic protein FliO [Clostridium sp. Sa3CUN1]|uniref:Flagellar biosynthetic protein FliO n=1 Tax=Clostridium gallinarum TaxID=2762246 RepID=A0ABR8Q4G7_9CLOT|nr:flagellar biosynthetic protein FliO [Clostridium gallinarum]MBD7915316.1 flagellar biosynthetic protein FliO [Clostridium gallinarum]
MELAFLIIKLIFAFLVVFSLMYLVFKLSGDKFNKLNEGKYIKILERTQISKDSSIAVVKVGKKGYVLSTTSNKVEKLDDLTEEEINLLEEGKKEEKERLNQQYDLILDKFKCNINRFKKKITKRKIV